MRQFLIITLFLALFTQIEAKVTKLRFNVDGKFKIVQFTDVHYAVEDPRTKESMKVLVSILEEEKPDLVVFTGDVVCSNQTAKGWDEVTAPLRERKIPFLVTLGNHDDEWELKRSDIARIVTEFPGNMNKIGAKEVYGVLQTAIPVYDNTGKKPSRLIYAMDSNAYSSIDTVKGYGWFTSCQIEWYMNESSRWRKLNGNNPVPALAFFHIPLPEYQIAVAQKNMPIAGKRLEDECSPKINTGMFAAMLKAGDVMGTFVGHDHVNDYLVSHYGIAMVYGRFSGGKNTYTSTPNGGRVILLDEHSKGFTTWCRISTNEVVDRVSFPE